MVGDIYPLDIHTSNDAPVIRCGHVVRMLVSLHITHSSAGGMSELNNVIAQITDAVSSVLKDNEEVKEYVIIRTCNRLEAYIAADDNPHVKAMLEKTVLGAVNYRDRQFWYILEDKASIKHLFTVACGMDSLIVGEDQIQHQTKESFENARKEGHVGKILYTFFTKALEVGKKVRTETDLNKGAVSVGYAAIELAENKIGTLDGKTIAILGAGDMAGVIAKNLAGKNPKTVFVSNRTFERACELAKELNGKAVGLEKLGKILAEADLLLVATSARHDVVRKDDVENIMCQRNRRPLLIIDVSVPTNVSKDVTEIDGVTLSTMESLDAIAAKNIAKRKDEISRAEKIITQEMERIEKQEKTEKADRVIREISILCENVRKQEVKTAKPMLPPGNDRIIDDMSRAIVKQVSADIIKNIREAALNGETDVVEAAAKIFGLSKKRED